MTTNDPTTADVDDAVAALDDTLVDAFGMLIEADAEVSNAVSIGLKRSVDLPLPWIGVLIRLARSPQRRMRMSELARDMTMSNSGLTRLVDRIEAAGHVTREACADDRRGLHAVLTRTGMDKVAAAVPGHVEDLQSIIGSSLSPDEVTELTELLRRVRDRARQFSDTD